MLDRQPPEFRLELNLPPPQLDVCFLGDAPEFQFAFLGVGQPAVQFGAALLYRLDLRLELCLLYRLELRRQLDVQPGREADTAALILQYISSIA